MEFKEQIEKILETAETDVKAGRVALMETTFSDLRRIIDEEKQLELTR